jgi:hypothetical protein
MGGGGVEIPMRAVAALALASLVSGCLWVTPSSLPMEPGSGASPAARPSSDVTLLDGFGDYAMEPHVAVRDAKGGPVVVVANANHIPGAVPGNTNPMAIEVHRSADGGATWESAPLPPSLFDAFDPLHRFTSTGDAVLAFTPDGTLFLAGVATTGTSHPDYPEAESLQDFSVFVAKSSDDGATWDGAVLWQEGTGPVAGFVHDKPWLVAGPDGTLHFTWTEFTGLVLTKIHYKRSADLGASWESPRDLALPDLTTLSQVTGSTIAAPGGGRVYVCFTDIRGDGSGARQLVVSSDDGGDTFGPAHEVGTAAFPRFGPRRAFVLVPSATDPPLMQVSATEDGGATWSGPAPLDASRGGAQQHPSAWVRDGRLVVGYYDAGWADGEHFTVTAADQHGGIASTPQGDPTAPGIYRREYLGLAGAGKQAWGAWVAGDEAAGTQVGVARLLVS